MSTERMTIEMKGQVPIRKRILILLAFLVSVNLLAGYVAITLGYESLYNVKPKFGEYALPLPMCWGFLHIPSMFLYGTLLALLPGMQQKSVRYFRIFCAVSFGLLLLEMDRKIPPLLFPKVDALTAFIFSLVVVPPNRKDNPVVVAAITLSAALATLALGYFCYLLWAHRTPALTTTVYQDGIFELKSISIRNDFHKSMDFEVDLKRQVEERHLCTQAQLLAADLMRDYPFDDTYKKVVEVSFNVPSPQSDLTPYKLGEIELEGRRLQEKGRYFCNLSYRTSVSR
jgi:hypothetical protein